MAIIEIPLRIEADKFQFDEQGRVLASAETSVNIEEIVNAIESSEVLAQQSDLETLLLRITSTRAGLLDNLTRLDRVTSILESNIRGIDGDTLKSLADDISAIEGGSNEEISSKLSIIQNTLAGAIASGAVQRRVVTKDTKSIDSIRGDTWPIPFTLGSAESWENKTVYFMAKKSQTAANSTAIVNRPITITDAVNRVGIITLTPDENAVVGKYYCELEAIDDSDGTTRTDYQGVLKIVQDVRQ